MAFVINKQSKRNGQIRKIYYLVENYRKDNKVKRKTLLTLGECKTVAELLVLIEKKEASLMDRLTNNERKLDEFLKTGNNPFSFGSPTDTQKMIKQNLVKYVERAKKDLQTCQSRKEEIKDFL